MWFLGLLRWSSTGAALIVLSASTLSAWYAFGVTKTVPYPNGNYAPIHTTIEMSGGALSYRRAQGHSHASLDSPYNVVGTHGLWYQIPAGSRDLCWAVERGGGWLLLPAWLLVGPPFAMVASLWTPVVARRLRRSSPFVCCCGYDRHGLAADAKCPECGTVPV
jgi:hypothetical protein